MAALLLAVVFLFAGALDGVVPYGRPPAGSDIYIPLSADLGSTSPQQVHISVVGKDKMRISWITEDSAPATVKYSTSPGVKNGISTSGTTSSYNYVTYTSGQIHQVVIGPLKPSTVYYYQCGSDSDSTLHFNFTTPPTQFPIKFAIAGDLGQTDWTVSTLQHISKSNYDVFLLPGDLSYADTIQPLWDSFGRLVEALARNKPWMVTQGNHEIETIPALHPLSFTSYNARWRMPFEESGSTSNLYYSFEVAGVHVVMLGSYDDFSPSSDQYKWLQSDLRKVDRGITPWLVVLIHAPWYNSNFAHQGEHESVDMKKDMEEMLYEARVDVVFTGHVHAYERFTRVYKDKADKCGIVHITIGDGGNREGLATRYKEPQPKISIFREASFGHGEFNVVNETHAEWSWHRNQDDESIISDSVWLRSLSTDPSCKL